jgi:hypothetical protein
MSAQAAQALLKNLTRVPDESLAAAPHLPLRPATLADYLHVAKMAFLAVTIGGAMFWAKRRMAMKAAIDRDRQQLGDLRRITRTRAV